MKIIVLLIFIFSAGTIITAQEVVSTAGETEAAAGYQLSWTIGEPVIETINVGATMLTQGFHQTKLTITALSEFVIPEIEVKVYPNPTHDFVIIKFNELIEDTGYLLYDLSGRILQQEKINEVETRLDLNKLGSGSYILKLNKNKKVLQDFKLIKR